jgi:tyrosinase
VDEEIRSDTSASSSALQRASRTVDSLSSHTMRPTLATAWLLPLALGSAIPSQEDNTVERRSFDLVDDILAGLGSIKQDLMAGGAAINQQLYQATQQPEQFKKCNPTNMHVRQEWLVYKFGSKSSAS